METIDRVRRAVTGEKTTEKAPAKADDKPQPACIICVTGPVKGHPPVTIEAFGRTPKEAVNGLRKLLANGRLEVIS